MNKQIARQIERSVCKSIEHIKKGGALHIFCLGAMSGFLLGETFVSRRASCETDGVSQATRGLLWLQQVTLRACFGIGSATC